MEVSVLLLKDLSLFKGKRQLFRETNHNHPRSHFSFEFDECNWKVKQNLNILI